MRLYFNLILAILASNLQGLAEAFTPDQNDLRNFQRASRPKSQMPKLRLAGLEVEPAKVKSKASPIVAAKYMFDTVGLAYCSPQDIMKYKGNYSKRLNKKFKPLNVIINKEYETQVFIGSLSARKEIMVVFRGSANNRNWDMNLKVNQVPFDNQKDVFVHSGFNTILYAMEPDLLNYLIPLFKEKQYQNYSIVFAGHSLGGSVATLATLKFPPKLNLPWKRVQLFTYGSPRVGNKEFANLINSKPIQSTRVVNNNDPVTKLPNIGYFHVHNELFIKGNNTIKCKTSTFEDPKCSQSLSFTLSSAAHNSAWDKTMVDEDC